MPFVKGHRQPPRISQAVVQAALEESARDSAEQERQFRERQATKKGDDPSRPWHPVFNPDPADRLAAQVRYAEDLERRKFEPLWAEIIAGIKARRFRDKKAIAEAYGRSYGWILGLLRVAVRQRVFSQAELNAYLKGKTPGQPITIQRTPRGGTRALCREDFEQAFQARGLTFDLAIRLLRLGAWKSLQDLSSDFSKGQSWATALRTFLVRERLFTPEEWRQAFRATDWGRATRKYLRAKEDEAEA